MNTQTAAKAKLIKGVASGTFHFEIASYKKAMATIRYK